MSTQSDNGPTARLTITHVPYDPAWLDVGPRPDGQLEIGRMLAFRDWLRSHDEDRDRYQDVKRQLGTRTWRHIDDYSDAKTTVIGEILRRMADAAS